MNIDQMTPEQFRAEISKHNHFEVAKMATQMIESRGNNTHNWKIKVYPNHAVENYVDAKSSDEVLKFWCYLNEDKTIVHTKVYKDGESLKLGLSATIDRFGDRWWFSEIESALKKQNWL